VPPAVPGKRGDERGRDERRPESAAVGVRGHRVRVLIDRSNYPQAPIRRLTLLSAVWKYMRTLVQRRQTGLQPSRSKKRSDQVISRSIESTPGRCGDCRRTTPVWRTPGTRVPRGVCDTPAVQVSPGVGVRIRRGTVCNALAEHRWG
jgi:hypothetical protein